MLGHKVSLSKFKKIEIISSILSILIVLWSEINQSGGAGWGGDCKKHKHMEAKQNATEQQMAH